MAVMSERLLDDGAMEWILGGIVVDVEAEMTSAVGIRHSFEIRLIEKIVV